MHLYKHKKILDNYREHFGFTSTKFDFFIKLFIEAVFTFIQQG